MKYAKAYDALTRVWAGPICIMFANSAEDLQILFNSKYCIEKASIYRVLPIGDGLVTASGNFALIKLSSKSRLLRAIVFLQPTYGESTGNF